MTKMIIVDAAEPAACPKCSHLFPLSDGISRQAIERHAQDFEQALAGRAKRLEAELAAASQAKVDQARAAAREQFETDLKAAQEALAAKDEFLSKSRTAELDLRRQLRESDEQRKNQELEYQRKLDDERKRIQEAARTSASEEFSRKEAQLRAQIESAQREAADLKRKLEQGSQQTQGEALELGLEAMLKAAFPQDDVLPVPKGVTGADLLQRVRSPSGHHRFVSH